MTTNQDFVQEMMTLQNKIEELVKQHLEGRDPRELQFKVNPDKWSALECMDHLNRYDDHYLPLVKKAMDRYPVKKGGFRYSWLGKKFVKMMEPNGTKTFKALKDMNPSLSAVDPQTARRYLSNMDEMRTLIADLERANLNKRCIPTTMSSFIVLKLGDIIHFLLMHKYRHTLQAVRALKEAEIGAAKIVQ
ncbi:DinB family protein [bacterium SCSIO 12741]|nr:DinB family protein [bacterium SCSIO 12741]